MMCILCESSFEELAHFNLNSKQICNKCCSTSKYRDNGIFSSCECERKEQK